MFNIYMVYPHKLNKFYINPYYLQFIQAKIKNRMHDQANVQLFDVNCYSEDQKLDFSNADLVIIDTPENSCEEVVSLIERSNSSMYLLIGDTIKYGQTQRLLTFLNKIFNKSVYGCADDDIIDSIVYELCSKQTVSCSSSDFFFANINSCYCPLESDNGLFIEFPDEILQSYEKHGIQIFMDGISRGCEYNCSFCKLGNNPHLRTNIKICEIDVEGIIKNLQNRCSKKIFIQFTDENFFGGGVKRLESIISFAEKLSSIEYDGCLGIDTRLDTIVNVSDSEYVSFLRKNAWNAMIKAGLKYCFLGLESFVPSQAYRYNKRLDLRNFEMAIDFFVNRNISFTIGLILWDPLMTVSELKENLRYIREHQLIGSTASLLKPLRIQVNSVYWKSNSKIIQESKLVVEDYFHVSPDSYHYQDNLIQKMIPYVRDVYSLFNENGYRHSDVALFDAILDESAPDILFQIPKLVSQLEYNLLNYFLSLKDTDFDNPSYIQNWIFDNVYEVVDNICTRLNTVKLYLNNQDSFWNIFDYYYNVFIKIKRMCRKRNLK